MRHTIELSEAGEASLRRMAQSVGEGEEALLRSIVEATLVGGIGLEPGEDEVPIRSTPNVMGGDACIRNTRIPVWMLVGYKQAGYTDDRILYNFPSLDAADLAAAWGFYTVNTERVVAERRRHEEAD